MGKAQITIFLLLGIVILAVFAFLYYVANPGGNLKEDSEKIYSDFLQASSLKINIQTCLEVTTKKAIQLAAIQGGKIYDGQIGKETKPDSLVLYLPFDKQIENNGAKVQDYALSNNGTISQTLQWTFNGRFGGAYYFPENGYIFFNDKPELNFRDDKDFTLSLWLKTNTTNQPVLVKGESAKHYNIFIDSKGTLVCSIGNGSDTMVVNSTSAQPITDGRWHHIACTVARQSNMILFIDSKTDNSTDIRGLTGSITNTTSLLMGASLFGKFNGTIDEVAIFNKSLTENEIIWDTYNRRIIQDKLSSNDIVPVSKDKIFIQAPDWAQPYYEVSYGITAPVAALNNPNTYTNYNLEVPLYPYGGSLVKNPVYKYHEQNSTLTFKNHSSMFGYYNEYFPTFTKLCNIIGPNLFSYANATYSCETYSIYGYSTQSMITDYITNNIKNCIDFERFKNNYKYNITQGDISADVLFGQNDVLIFLYYPLSIKVKNKPPITKIEQFSFKPDIPFKRICNLAQHIIGSREEIRGNIPETETDNIFYNISNDPWDCWSSIANAKISCLIENHTIKITRINDYCKTADAYGFCTNDKHYDYSDIIKITDENSSIEGKELSFIFAVENRVPALDFIDESIGNIVYYSQYLLLNYDRLAITLYNKTNTSFIKDNYNIIVDAGQQIELFPFGIDPDDESVTYRYSGWKTDEMIVNGTYNPQYYQDPYLPFPLDTSGMVSGSGAFSINHWQQSSYYLNKFNSSTEKGKDANNITTLDDVGYHWIRINVTDSEGLSDYQDIKIQVRCPEGHSCCNQAEDYHWFIESVQKTCDLSDGWPCVFISSPPYAIEGYYCDPGY